MKLAAAKYLLKINIVSVKQISVGDGVHRNCRMADDSCKRSLISGAGDQLSGDSSCGGRSTE
jgi:hypothetical protein